MSTYSHRFYTKVFNFFRPFVGASFRRRSDFTEPSVPELPAQFLLIFNHVSNADSTLLGVAIRRQFFFVATENVLYHGLSGRFLRTFFDPVALPKGGQTSGAVAEILRRLKAGDSIAFSPEGYTSWDGRTAPFPPATGKFLRAAGVPVVTCRIQGGYFFSPRWGYTERKGPLTVSFVHIYPPEELRSLSSAEITARVAEDIREDAYETLRRQNASYRGRDLAKGIEHALVVCPSCHGIGTLKSRGNCFFCGCGFEGSLDEKGTLHRVPWDTIPAWEDWQQDFLAKLAASRPSPEQVLASDPELILAEVVNHKRLPLARGPVSMTAAQLTVGEQRFPLDDIRAMEIRLRGSLCFSLKDGRYFELLPARKKQDYSGRKYKLLFDHLKTVPAV